MPSGLVTLSISISYHLLTFFYIGGGQQICPHCHFAKHEIMITIALLVSKFDIESVGWSKLGGSPSDRPAQINGF
jgi:hypothetical protein